MPDTWRRRPVCALYSIRDSSRPTPISPWRMRRPWRCPGGEDYELCFVSPPGVTDPWAEEFQARFGTGLTRVGHVEEGTGVEVVGGADGQEHVSGGFDHFSFREGSC